MTFTCYWEVFSREKLNLCIVHLETLFYEEALEYATKFGYKIERIEI